MATVNFKDVSLTYPGASKPTVTNLNLDIADGEFLVLVGPSGCGKSTVLRMLAGLQEVTSGAIHIGDKDVTDLEPKARDIAMVFQDYALYPHMSVRENMSFPLQLANTPKAEMKERVEQVADLLDLSPYLDRKPKDLSGGQRQRVAMGRAIVRHPQVFLMDEPLSNLDAKLRVQTRAHIAQLQRELGVTTVYVTHDQVEAMTMGDRVAVLNFGDLQQVAAPKELYERPANAFVAGFIGSPSMNLLPATVSGRTALIDGYQVELAGVPSERLEGRSNITVGVRPEGVKLTDNPQALAAEVVIVEELGADSYVYARVPELSIEEPVVCRLGDAPTPDKGQQVRLEIDPQHIHAFDPDSGVRLNAD
ncbi:ABC transporter ATP-binding protein [Corynebacterium ulceribovis]|uniref:ABC transporter ATP-binding protein n=1 Tax=Corynebacterium ulceribovis TaxID=487732 RepID=UPI0003684F3B|nr:sn-glycerol-3-phosphate ABC transporter ATP-binding protein UgpC [Corynebacterium ulceribovis]